MQAKLRIALFSRQSLTIRRREDNIVQEVRFGRQKARNLRVQITSGHRNRPLRKSAHPRPGLFAPRETGGFPAQSAAALPMCYGGITMLDHSHPRTRFAPSPTGYMHVGNLRTARCTPISPRRQAGRTARLFSVWRTPTRSGSWKAQWMSFLTPCAKPALSGTKARTSAARSAPISSPSEKRFIKNTSTSSSNRVTRITASATRKDWSVRTLQRGRASRRATDRHCLSLSKEEIAQKLAEGIRTSCASASR